MARISDISSSQFFQLTIDQKSHLFFLTFAERESSVQKELSMANNPEVVAVPVAKKPVKYLEHVEVI